MKRANFACSLCGSRDWPRPGAWCPLCAEETQDARLEDSREDEDASAGEEHYSLLARQDVTRGVLCMAGAVWLAVLCVVSAFSMSALWAVICGCGAVFCRLGARVYFHDSKIHRQKAQWRK